MSQKAPVGTKKDEICKKVTILLEELLALGHSGAEYDAYLVDILEGEQFGSGFVDANPNSKIPA